MIDEDDRSLVHLIVIIIEPGSYFGLDLSGSKVWISEAFFPGRADAKSSIL